MIAVIGAGICGLAAAEELSRLGELLARAVLSDEVPLELLPVDVKP